MLLEHEHGYNKIRVDMQDDRTFACELEAGIQNDDEFPIRIL